MNNIEDMLNQVWRNAFINIYKKHGIIIKEWMTDKPFPLVVFPIDGILYYDDNFVKELEKANQEVEDLMSR